MPDKRRIEMSPAWALTILTAGGVIGAAASWQVANRTPLQHHTDAPTSKEVIDRFLSEGVPQVFRPLSSPRHRGHQTTYKATHSAGAGGVDHQTAVYVDGSRCMIAYLAGDTVHSVLLIGRTPGQAEWLTFDDAVFQQHLRASGAR